MNNPKTKSHLFATTFIEGFDDPRFEQWATKIDVPPALDSLSKREISIIDEIILFFRILKSTRTENALLLFSSRGRVRPELLAIIVLGLCPKILRPVIVLYGEMFEPNQGLRHSFERLIMKFVDRVVDRYILFSNAELDVFPDTWGASKEKIRICNQFYLPPNRVADYSDKPSSKHIFAGGNSFRDYDAFIEAASRMPEYTFEVCTTRIAPDRNLPIHVKVSWPPLQEYLDLIYTAAAVVIPIKMGLKRTAGLLTCFEAMWLQKTIIVPRALGMEDYIQDRVTGLLVEGSPESYIKAIEWVLDPVNAKSVEKIGNQARQSIAEKFTLQRYNNCVISIMDNAIDSRNH